MTRTVSSGTHTLSVRLKVTEPFGWGLALSLTGEGLKLLPASRDPLRDFSATRNRAKIRYL